MGLRRPRKPGELAVNYGGKAVDYLRAADLQKMFLLRFKRTKMATAGYSGTPLLKKLGIKPGMKLLLINQPIEYMNWLQKDINDQLCSKNESPQLVHLFATSNKEFEHEMKKLSVMIRKNTGITIWVSWYKKSAKIPTDITEDVIRNYALGNGLVDVKVCAVSEQWSGLKLVVPLNRR